MANVNYFLALWVTFTFIGAGVATPLLMPLTFLLGRLPPWPWLGWVGALWLPVTIFVTLVVIWWRKEALSPLERKPGTNGRFVAGHICAFIGNIAVIGGLAAEMTIGTMGYGLGMALVLGQPLYLVAIVCIEMARQRIPAVNA